MVKKPILAFSIILIIFSVYCTKAEKTIYGKWKFVPEKSTDLVTWQYRNLELEVRKDQEMVVILQKWLRRNQVKHIDSVSFVPGDKPNTIPVRSPIWSKNWYMGVLRKIGSLKTVSGRWEKPDKVLVTKIESTVDVSQGSTTIETTWKYKLDDNGNVLIAEENRSTRPTPVKYVFQRKD